MQGSIFIAATPGTSWPLDLDTVSRHWRERFPDTQLFRKHAPVSDTDYVDFQLELDGEIRACSYFADSKLILNDGTSTLWADTIVWFLRLLPAGSTAVAMVEVNPDEIAPVPAGVDAAAIVGLLDRLADADKAGNSRAR